MIIDVSKNKTSNIINEVLILEYKYYTLLEMDNIINEEGLLSKIKDTIKQIINKAIDYIKSIYTKFKNWIQSCKSKIQEIKETKNYIKDLYNSLSDYESSWKDIYDNIDFDESSYKSEMDSMINEVKNGMKNFAKEASQYSHEFETDMKRSDYWDPDIIPSAPSYQFELSRFEPTRFR